MESTIELLKKFIECLETDDGAFEEWLKLTEIDKDLFNLAEELVEGVADDD